MMGIFSMGSMWVIWAIIVVAVILLLKGQFSVGKAETQAESSTESALEVLKMQYARGGIDKEKFDEKKRRLMS
jgi:uncharacterized membrane protein